jgi:hypothetical protein
MSKHLRPIVTFLVLPALILVAFAVSTAFAGGNAGKTTICHQAANKFVEITVSNNALPAHFAHGDVTPDQYGDCP